MKKNWKWGALMALAACVGLTSCEEDEALTTPSTPPALTAESPDFFILNEGQIGQMDGSLSWYDYDAGQMNNNVFLGANGRSLGDTPNRCTIYGSKLYIAVNVSNTIEVVDARTFRSLKQISLANHAVIGEPRDVIGHNGFVYVSLYSGHVARIDTTTLAFDTKVVKVGDNPEIMAISGDYLYVPNSFYGKGTTVSQIRLSTFENVKTIDGITNPMQMLTDAAGHVYALTGGTYDAAWNQIGAGVYKLDLDGTAHTLVCPATIADIPAGSNTLYTVNAPYGSATVTYNKVNLTGTEGYQPEALPLSAESPCGLAVDPLTGNIVLTSLAIIGGWPSYDTDGYALLYSPEGSLLKRVEVGVSPCGIVFLNQQKVVRP